MRQILLDTNAFPAFMLGAEAVVEVAAYADGLLVVSVELGESLGGLAAGSCEPKCRAELARFLDAPRVELAPLSARTAGSCTLLHAGCRRKGQPIPTNDLWIAASALEHGAALLASDAHFAQIDDLRCGRPLEDFLS